MKTIAKRLIAAIAAMTLLIPSASVWAARGATDVNVAAGKSAISSVYGEGGYNSDTVVANVTGEGIFISCASHEQTELVTVDLGVRYPINEILVATYGNNTSTDSYGFGSDAVFEVYVSNTNPGQYTDLSTTDGVKLNVIGDTQFVAADGGGYNSYYELDTAGSYRYVQLKYIKGTDAVADLYLNEIEVYTSQESASNVPTVISVGKPIYSDFFDGYNAKILALNDGDFTTEHWAYTGSGEFGNGISGINSDGTVIDGYYDHIINLEAKYPIEKVTVTKPTDCGSVDGVSVSNDPNAAAGEWLPLVYDDGDDAYYIDPIDAADLGSDYQFVKIELTPGDWYGDRFVGGIKEVSVYTTSAAAAAATEAEDLVNIAVGKSFTSNDPNGYGDQFVSYVNDGNMSTQWFTFAGTPQITYDLGRAYTIENVRTYKQGNWTNDGRISGYAIAKVEVSNDPNFNSDSTVTLSGQKYRIDNSDNGWTNYTSYSQNELPADFGKYRYVRVTGNPNADVAWQLNEVEIYTNKADNALQNMSLKSTATFINGGSAGLDSTIEDLIDGDSSTYCYSASGMAVIKLPYPMTIEQIEVDSRPGYDSLTDNFTNLGGYNIWISSYPLEGDWNLPEEAGTCVKVSNAERVDQTGNRLYHAGATVVTEIEDENKYEYVTVQCPANAEFFIYDVRILSDDIIEGTAITNELTGETAKGEVLTLTAGYRGETAIDKVVDLYIARYDCGVLTDIEISENNTFSGQVVTETLDYTITEDVTAQTEFKGFVWEKDTMQPFALNAEIEPYAEFWVDPNAAENGDGSKASPFNSIRAARDAVRAVNDNMEGDIVVNLKGGKYYVDNENYIFLGDEDGGSNGYNVIYKNAPGETAVISGGKPITGFEEGENGIWYADASDFDSIYELTVNGEAATLARTENPITATKLYGDSLEGDYTGYSGGIGFSKNDLPAISDPEDAFVHVASSWVDIMYTVDSVSEDGNDYKFVVDSNRLKATTKNEAFSGNHTIVDKGDKFYIENAKELLDNPGEFYFDKDADSKVLYYMPRSGENMETAVVEAAISDSLVNISGSRDNHVKNIILSGIKFENATYANMYANGFTTAQAQVVKLDSDTFIQGSIWVNYADSIEISDCEFTGITKPAISFVEGVLDSTVTRNKFSNIGNSAVVVGTNNHEELEYAGEERCERNTISDNVIYKPAQIFRGSPAIACYYVIDTDIVHNKMMECNYSGISLGWGWADFPDLTVCADNRVANNYIENINLIAADGGAVYTLGNLPDAVIEGNYYVQTKMPQQISGTIGIYTDEGTQNVTIRNNVIDMAAIEAYEGDRYAIGAWTSNIKNVVATDNYATLTDINNSGTNCTIETPTAYTNGQEPAAVQEIIAASAINLR